MALASLDTANGDYGGANRNLHYQTVFLSSILVKPTHCKVKTIRAMNNLFSD